MSDIQRFVEARVRPEIRALDAYHVPDSQGLIKLDAMENPFPWPDEIKAAWCARLREVEVNRYPDPAARRLKARLHTAMDVPAGMELLLGNGSDEIIQMIAMALARPGAVLLAPTPTFVMYDMIARFTGMTFVGVPLRAADFGLDMDAMLAAVAEHDPAVIFLAYPNNPTGNLFDTADIEALIRESRALVVVDEAYHAFAGHSFMGRLAEFDRVVVMRTVSKLGLAGLRLGLLAGPGAWLAEFDKVRLPYNINSLTQVSAAFALEQREFLDRQTALIRRERERLAAALAELNGVQVWPSAANFVLFRVADAAAIHDGLRRAGVLIKLLGGAGGGELKDCLRVTVGRESENDAFIAALRGLL